MAAGGLEAVGVGQLWQWRPGPWELKHGRHGRQVRVPHVQLIGQIQLQQFLLDTQVLLELLPLELELDNGPGIAV